MATDDGQGAGSHEDRLSTLLESSNSSLPNLSLLKAEHGEGAVAWFRARLFPALSLRHCLDRGFGAAGRIMVCGY